MSDITFSREEKEVIAQKIKMYFREELDQEIGQFDAEFLLDFFTGEIGPRFYNKGLYDALAVLDERMESVRDDIYGIEQQVSR